MIAELLHATERHGGVTYSTREQQIIAPQDAWYFPKYPNLTKIVSLENVSAELQRFIGTHEALLAAEDCFLGLWQNPQTGKIYIDICNRNRKRAYS